MCQALKFCTILCGLLAQIPKATELIAPLATVGARPTNSRSGLSGVMSRITLLAYLSVYCLGPFKKLWSSPVAVVLITSGSTHCVSSKMMMKAALMGDLCQCVTLVIVAAGAENPSGGLCLCNRPEGEFVQVDYPRGNERRGS